jgi:hypothetical protein
MRDWVRLAYRARFRKMNTSGLPAINFQLYTAFGRVLGEEQLFREVTLFRAVAAVRLWRSGCDRPAVEKASLNQILTLDSADDSIA